MLGQGGRQEKVKVCRRQRKETCGVTGKPATLKPAVENFRHSLQNSVSSTGGYGDVIHTSTRTHRWRDGEKQQRLVHIQTYTCRGFESHPGQLLFFS